MCALESEYAKQVTRAASRFRGALSDTEGLELPSLQSFPLARVETHQISSHGSYSKRV